MYSQPHIKPATHKRNLFSKVPQLSLRSAQMCLSEFYFSFVAILKYPTISSKLNLVWDSMSDDTYLLFTYAPPTLPKIPKGKEFLPQRAPSVERNPCPLELKATRKIHK